jgi:NAD(P)-dependent dehydrogenase (short-subunit alcohol dehydrogenase family)
MLVLNAGVFPKSRPIDELRGDDWRRVMAVNVVHPNAVFDTGIWDPATIASWAASYAMTVEQYKRSNLLGVEITSGDVANVIVALCSDTFAKTTGAQVPIDGGTERTI